MVSKRVSDPYYHLGLAILAQAVRDACSTQRHISESALGWLELSHDFVVMLGLNPQLIHSRLMQIRASLADEDDRNVPDFIRRQRQLELLRAAYSRYSVDEEKSRSEDN